jgi:hypothetical protein
MHKPDAKKFREGGRPKDLGAPQEKRGKPVVLNFDEYPDLLKQLNAQAQDEFRPLDMQIMYQLKKGLSDGEA